MSRAVLLVGAAAGLAALAWAVSSSASMAPSSGEVAADTEGGAAPTFLDDALDTLHQVEGAFSFGDAMRTSDAGLAALEREEGIELEQYNDEAGRPTIYVGHLIKAGEVFNNTQAEAYQVLARDLAPVEDALNSLVTVPLTQPQFDALVSLVFNIGVHNFRGSTLLKVLNAGDYLGAAAQFPRWKYITRGGQKIESAELVGRRSRESTLFASAEYTVGSTA